jgi:hypothetical protein
MHRSPYIEIIVDYLASWLSFHNNLNVYSGVGRFDMF